MMVKFSVVKKTKFLKEKKKKFSLPTVNIKKITRYFYFYTLTILNMNCILKLTK
jgi:hypothetical protein